jgi:hypothetical protein
MEKRIKLPWETTSLRKLNCFGGGTSHKDQVPEY